MAPDTYTQENYQRGATMTNNMPAGTDNTLFEMAPESPRVQLLADRYVTPPFTVLNRDEDLADAADIHRKAS